MAELSIVEFLTWAAVGYSGPVAAFASSLRQGAGADVGGALGGWRVVLAVASMIGLLVISNAGPAIVLSSTATVECTVGGPADVTRAERPDGKGMREFAADGGCPSGSNQTATATVHVVELSGASWGLLHGLLFLVTLAWAAMQMVGMLLPLKKPAGDLK